MKQALVVIICLSSLVGYSQGDFKSRQDTAGVSVKADKNFFKLFDTYTAMDKKALIIQGYRIQIVSSSDRASVLKVKSEFFRRFNTITTYVKYQQPNFKLRVGNYRNKLEAQKALLEITRHYPDAFVVRVDIPLKELQPEEEDTEK